MGCEIDRVRTGVISLLEFVPLGDLTAGRGLDLLPVVQRAPLALRPAQAQSPDHLYRS